MSSLISATAVSWSGVSWYGKAASNSPCQSLSTGKANPGTAFRMACSWIMSAAMSRTASDTRSFRLPQAVPPSLLSSGWPCDPPTYFCTKSMRLAGTYSITPSRNSRIRFSSVAAGSGSGDSPSTPPPLSSIFMPRKRAMPWATWTT